MEINNKKNNKYYFKKNNKFLGKIGLICALRNIDIQGRVLYNLSSSLSNFEKEQSRKKMLISIQNFNKIVKESKIGNSSFIINKKPLDNLQLLVNNNIDKLKSNIDALKQNIEKIRNLITNKLEQRKDKEGRIYLIDKNELKSMLLLNKFDNKKLNKNKKKKKKKKKIKQQPTTVLPPIKVDNDFAINNSMIKNKGINNNDSVVLNRDLMNIDVDEINKFYKLDVDSNREELDKENKKNKVKSQSNNILPPIKVNNNDFTTNNNNIIKKNKGINNNDSVVLNQKLNVDFGEIDLGELDKFLDLEI